jgi:hypothetical protein
MTRIVLTDEDYAALPNDGKRYELHDGVLPPFFDLTLDPAAIWP